MQSIVFYIVVTLNDLQWEVRVDKQIYINIKQTFGVNFFLTVILF